LEAIDKETDCIAKELFEKEKLEDPSVCSAAQLSDPT